MLLAHSGYLRIIKLLIPHNIKDYRRKRRKTARESKQIYTSWCAQVYRGSNNTAASSRQQSNPFCSEQLKLQGKQVYYQEWDPRIHRLLGNLCITGKYRFYTDVFPYARINDDAIRYKTPSNTTPNIGALRNIFLQLTHLLTLLYLSLEFLYVDNLINTCTRNLLLYYAHKI